MRAPLSPAAAGHGACAAAAPPAAAPDSSFVTYRPVSQIVQ